MSRAAHLLQASLTFRNAPSRTTPVSTRFDDAAHATREWMEVLLHEAKESLSTPLETPPEHPFLHPVDIDTDEPGIVDKKDEMHVLRTTLPVPNVGYTARPNNYRATAKKTEPDAVPPVHSVPRDEAAPLAAKEQAKTLRKAENAAAGADSSAPHPAMDTSRVTSPAAPHGFPRRSRLCRSSFSRRRAASRALISRSSRRVDSMTRSRRRAFAAFSRSSSAVVAAALPAATARGLERKLGLVSPRANASRSRRARSRARRSRDARSAEPGGLCVHASASSSAASSAASVDARSNARTSHGSSPSSSSSNGASIGPVDARGSSSRSVRAGRSARLRFRIRALDVASPGVASPGDRGGDRGARVSPSRSRRVASV